MGEQCRSAGALADAATVLRVAVGQSGSAADRARAHYDLAVTLADLRARGQTCGVGATMDEILSHLAEAVHLDPSLRTRMRDEQTFAGVRDTLRFQVLAGADLHDPRTLRRVLSRAPLYGPPQGVWGSVSQLDLRPDGTYLLKTRKSPSDTMHFTEQVGRWRVEAGAVLLKRKGQELRYEVDSSGKLLLDGNAAWTDTPPECSA